MPSLVRLAWFRDTVLTSSKERFTMTAADDTMDTPQDSVEETGQLDPADLEEVVGGDVDADPSADDTTTDAVAPSGDHPLAGIVG